MSDKELIKKLKREYAKKWRDANKDKVKASNERYWLRKAEQYKNNRSDEQTANKEKTA